jgi:hypothetical protein
MTARPAESPDARNESLPAGDHRELARQAASGFEVFGQSLAATGPSIAVAGCTTSAARPPATRHR